jgi:hypothetical protein
MRTVRDRINAMYQDETLQMLGPEQFTIEALRMLATEIDNLKATTFRLPLSEPHLDEAGDKA